MYFINSLVQIAAIRLPWSRQTHKYTQGISLAFYCNSFVFKRFAWQLGLSSERERSGLKGSLSTYTPTENQSIVRGAGLVGMGVREGERREKELRLFQGSTRITEIL